MEENYEGRMNSVIEVFLQMMQTTPYFDISVSDISEQAKISRVTFYKYFVDKEDLLWKAFLQTYLEVTDKVNNVDTRTLLSDGKPLTYYVFENIKKHHSFYRNLFVNGMPYEFQCRFLDYMTTESYRTHEALRMIYTNTKIPYVKINQYLAGALFHLIRKLLEEDEDFDSLEMANFFTNLAAPGIMSMCKMIS